MNSQKVYIYNNGCSRRLLDGKRIRDFFKTNGWKLVNSATKADLVILNTCGLTQAGIDYAEKLIIENKKLGKQILLCGCVPKIKPSLIKKHQIESFFSPTNFSKINQLIHPERATIEEIGDKNLLTLKDVSPYTKFYLNQKLPKLLAKLPIQLNKKEAFYLRISHGCSFNCSYCSIKTAVGKLKSKSLDTCLNELKKGIRTGNYHIIITAEDVGAYGRDLGTTFPLFLQKIIKTVSDKRLKIYIQELNPFWLIFYQNDLARLLKQKQIIRIMCPVQSGSEKILKQMNRPYQIKPFKKTVAALKKSFPEIQLETHIIVGFPGETEEDFNKTLNLLTEVGFLNVGFFPYQENDQTRSRKYPNKVNKKTVQKRIAQATKFCQQNNIHIVNPDDWLFPPFH